MYCPDKDPLFRDYTNETESIPCNFWHRDLRTEGEEIPGSPDQQLQDSSDQDDLHMLDPDTESECESIYTGDPSSSDFDSSQTMMETCTSLRLSLRKRDLLQPLVRKGKWGPRSDLQENKVKIRQPTPRLWPDGLRIPIWSEKDDVDFERKHERLKIRRLNESLQAEYKRLWMKDPLRADQHMQSSMGRLVLPGTQDCRISDYRTLAV